MSHSEVVDDITAADEPPVLGHTARNVAFAVIVGGLLLSALDGTIVATALRPDRAQRGRARTAPGVPA
jgi:hypothetical protein